MWWESGDDVTLIACPRRFGKTLTLSMPEQFFSVRYQGRGICSRGLEFKVHDDEDEQSLEDTVQAALAQIAEKQYAAELLARGLMERQIHRYGFAFE